MIADAGYSSRDLIRRIRDHYSSTAVIQINPGHKALRRRYEQLRKTPQWKALLRQRSAVERTYSRLKGQRSLDKITVRGRRKVTVHCYLALIALQGMTKADRHASAARQFCLVM